MPPAYAGFAPLSPQPTACARAKTMPPATPVGQPALRTPAENVETPGPKLAFGRRGRCPRLRPPGGRAHVKPQLVGRCQSIVLHTGETAARRVDYFSATIPIADA
jgi:hypothetical protein